MFPEINKYFVLQVNAAYFKTKWEYKFNGSQIVDFHLSDFDTRKIEMMYTRNYFYKGSIFSPPLLSLASA